MIYTAYQDAVLFSVISILLFGLTLLVGCRNHDYWTTDHKGITTKQDIISFWQCIRFFKEKKKYILWLNKNQLVTITLSILLTINYITCLRCHWLSERCVALSSHLHQSNRHLSLKSNDFQWLWKPLSKPYHEKDRILYDLLTWLDTASIFIQAFQTLRTFHSLSYLEFEKIQWVWIWCRYFVTVTEALKHHCKHLGLLLILIVKCPSRCWCNKTFKAIVIH